MKRNVGLAAVLASGLLLDVSSNAQAGVEKLYILNCG